jgi:hypothetical protein
MAKAETNWIAILLLTMAAFAYPASAAEFRSVNQMPLALLANKVVLTSIGNTVLKVSYLEGEWKEIEIKPGNSISFPQTGQSVSIRFHDGVDVRTQSLAPSTQYIIFFNSQNSRWEIQSYDSVIRSSTGLRSQ